MESIEVERMVDADGVLRLEIPMGAAEAGRPVRVTATALPWPLTPEEYRRVILSTAGGWIGEFERPVDPLPADPEWMNDPNYAGFVKISDYPAGEAPGEEDDPSGVRRNQPDRSERRS